MGKTPLFRKAIVPWWDSEAACYSVIVFMVAVLLFGILGVAVTREIHEYRAYGWVPVVLILMSLTVLISTAIRMMRRIFRRYPG